MRQPATSDGSKLISAFSNRFHCFFLPYNKSAIIERESYVALNDKKQAIRKLTK
jgi:hypothetical protein